MSRNVVVTISSPNDVRSAKDAPMISVVLKKSGIILAEALCYYPGDHKSADWHNLLAAMKPIERQWLFQHINYFLYDVIGSKVIPRTLEGKKIQKIHETLKNLVEMYPEEQGIHLVKELVETIESSEPPISHLKEGEG